MMVKQELKAQGFICRTCGEFKSKKHTKYVYVDLHTNLMYCFSHRFGESFG
jgi:hypothetical protein